MTRFEPLHWFGGGVSHSTPAHGFGEPPVPLDDEDDVLDALVELLLAPPVPVVALDDALDDAPPDPPLWPKPPYIGKPHDGATNDSAATHESRVKEAVTQRRMNTSSCVTFMVGTKKTPRVAIKSMASSSR